MSRETLVSESVRLSGVHDISIFARGKSEQSSGTRLGFDELVLRDEGWLGQSLRFLSIVLIVLCGAALVYRWLRRTTTRPSQMIEEENLSDSVRPGPPSASFSPSHYRYLLLPALIPVLWLLTQWIEFRTEVEITSDAHQLRWQVGEGSWTAPVNAQRFDSLEISVSDSLYRMGGSWLIVEQAGKKVLEERLPVVFDLDPSEFHATGDWWIDERAPGQVVYRRELSISGPFKLRASFRGRCLKFTRLTLKGSSQLDFIFRRGFLNNDAFIEFGGPPAVAGGSIPVRWKEGLAGVAEIVTRSLLAACALVCGFWLLSRVRLKLLPERWFGGTDWAVAHPRLLGSAVLASASFLLAVSWWVSSDVLGGLAHFQDSVAYFLQAKWLQANLLYQGIPDIHRHLPIPFTFFTAGKWITQYPIGWPLLLGLADALRGVLLVGPLLGSKYSVNP